jgi:uracil-DNA glycosylase
MATSHVALRPGADLDGFRAAVRGLLAQQVAPHDVAWGDEAQLSLIAAASPDHAAAIMLPRALVELIEDVVCHDDPQRYALLYALVWRILHGEPALLDVASDPLVHRLRRMQKAVRRDIHKMHAFLRFRRIAQADTEQFVAWFEPEHHIVAAVAPFFVERFGSLVWSIITPRGSLHWDRTTLTVGEPGRRADAPAEDAFEAGWRAYYESVFNPARANAAAMRLHMPKKYWRNMPETAAIPHLLHGAATRVSAMTDATTRTPPAAATTSAPARR